MGLASEGEARTHTASLDTTLLARAISYMPPASLANHPRKVRRKARRGMAYLCHCVISVSHLASQGLSFHLCKTGREHRLFPVYLTLVGES